MADKKISQKVQELRIRYLLAISSGSSIDLSFAEDLRLSPTFDAVRAWALDEGLVAEGLVGLRVTPRAARYIQHLCEQGLPFSRWLMPGERVTEIDYD